ncbi:MAG TPA: hypothetical protein VGD54_06275 [Steroidobacteraceae bacterium]
MTPISKPANPPDGNSTHTSSFSYTPLFWLALGTFAVGTEGFMIAAILPRIAGLNVAPVILSLNASFMYLGFSMGAALGAFTLAHGTVADLGWVGAICIVGALLLYFVTRPSISFCQPAQEAEALP